MVYIVFDKKTKITIKQVCVCTIWDWIRVQKLEAFVSILTEIYQQTRKQGM